MEYVDIYDRERHPTGKIQPRNSKLSIGEYRIIAFAVIVNSRCEALLTLRSPEKDVYPNLWGFTGGAVQAGETSLQAIERETHEETGIHAKPEDFILLDTFESRVKHSFTDVYLLRWDGSLDQLTMQPGETSAAQWVSLEALMQMATQIAPPDAERLPALLPLIYAKIDG